MYTFGVVEQIDDLKQILHLQQNNIKAILSSEEMQSQGFVTLEHDLDLLQEMNHPYPHIICKSDDRVVGYTLVMLKSFRDRFPQLQSLFQQIESITYHSKPLIDSRFFIMGQVCVAKEARGKGVFHGLYREMQERMRFDFDYIITEVDHRNPRSIRAHQKVGFETIHQYQAESGVWWDLILLPCST